MGTWVYFAKVMAYHHFAFRQKQTSRERPETVRCSFPYKAPELQLGGLMSF